MPKPLKKGYSIHVERIKHSSDYNMRTTDVYTDFYGIGYLINGDRKIITPNGVYFIHPGDVGITNIGLYHRTSSCSVRPYERYGVKFAPKMVEHLIRTIGEEKFQEFMSHTGYHLKLEAQKKVERIFKDMLYEYENYDDTSELLLEGMLNHLIVTIQKERILDIFTGAKMNIQDDIIMNVLAYLDIHFADNPSIDELSDIACLSRAQFMKRFKMAVGSSYKMYLNCYKIHHAQNILTNTNHSISEIAEELGFCNANYFCNVFKDISGQSPMDFRRERKN